MILNALALKLRRQARSDFKGRRLEASLIVQALSRHICWVPYAALMRMGPASRGRAHFRRRRALTSSVP
ncbi:hypothetical protein Mnod_4257 [Methylobacterium nodulans ORS 2060]|uniref:Transposase n=1 Tax=Methylobacterium nodulans (strain LMG 21967 / CNCM I-2342 / ORS 2060) TaxID=460265 RepID=B8IA70_METNO|nr:hypothetical protein Mnod_4257 [Methylobacterium nodulans ORS 2060]